MSSLNSKIAKEIHRDAREATARRLYRSIKSIDRPDIAIATILIALDDWYEKGCKVGRRRCEDEDTIIR